MKQKVKKKFSHIIDNAFDGLVRTIETEKNFRIELIIACIVTPAVLFLPMTLTERMGVWFFVVAVIYAELVNTAIERSVDTKTQEYSTFARDAKDAAAASVLVVSFAALLYFFMMIGIVISRIFY